MKSGYPPFIKLAKLLLVLLLLVSCDTALIVGPETSQPTISGLSQVTAKPGDEVAVTGKNLTSKIKVKVNGEAADFTLQDITRGSFILPADTAEGMVAVAIMLNSKTLSTYSLLNGDPSAAVSAIIPSASTTCSDVIYKDATGELVRGERNCGETLVACTTDGQTNCAATDEVPGALKSGLAAKVLTGQTVAGVSGSAALRPADCSVDGSTGCVAVTAFPAADKMAFAATDIRSGIAVAGILGTLNETADCSADGQTGCLANASYIAATVSGAAAKILSGQTLAGVAGTGDGQPNDCAADGETNCVAVTNFPAIDKVTLQTNASKIRSSLTLAGVPGTLDSF